MLTIAFLGEFKHEVSADQVQRLVTAAKKAVGDEGVVLCNADGLYGNAPRLMSQVSMFFDSGIEVVFLGSKALARAAGRAELGKWPLLRPLNSPLGSPGRGSMLLGASGKTPLWLLSVGQQDERNAFEPPHLALEDFFRNKSDPFPVLINVNGFDLDEKTALAWRFATGKTVHLLGTGTGYQTCNSTVGAAGNYFQADVGSIANEQTVGGMSVESWWKRKVERISVASALNNMPLQADFTTLCLDTDGKATRWQLHRVII